MFLLSPQIESSDAEGSKVKADIKSIYDRLPPQDDKVERRGPAPTIICSATTVLC
jgi:hypothetical protein